MSGVMIIDHCQSGKKNLLCFGSDLLLTESGNTMYSLALPFAVSSLNSFDVRVPVAGSGG